jgi:hypothetical protein
VYIFHCLHPEVNKYPPLFRWTDSCQRLFGVLEITRIISKVRKPELISRPKSELTQTNPDTIRFKINAVIFFPSSQQENR